MDRAGSSGAPQPKDTTMRQALLLAAIAAALAPGATSARTQAPSVRVAYGDLDLSTDSGRTRLEHRLATAVDRVCPAADIRDLAGTRASRRCAAETHARVERRMASLLGTRAVALASVDAPRPTAR